MPAPRGVLRRARRCASSCEASNEFEVRVKLPEGRAGGPPLPRQLSSCARRHGAWRCRCSRRSSRFKTGRGLQRASIRRDGRRVVNGLDATSSPSARSGQVIKVIARRRCSRSSCADYPGLTYTFEGSQAEMREATVQTLYDGLRPRARRDLRPARDRVPDAIVQPLIVLVAIPFGHHRRGHRAHAARLRPLAREPDGGDRALRRRRERQRSSWWTTRTGSARTGLSAFEAIRQAGMRNASARSSSRRRPPPAASRRSSSRSPCRRSTSIPMAISLGFGIVFATAITLLLVPALYLILEDLVRFTRFGPSEVPPNLGPDPRPPASSTTSVGPGAAQRARR